MNRKIAVSVFLPVVGLFALIASAYGSQALLQWFRQRNAQLFSFDLMFNALWSNALITLLCTGVLLGLFWVILTRSPKWIGWVFLIVGLFLVIYPIGSFYVLHGVGEIPPTPLLSLSMFLLDNLAPGSLFLGVAGGISMIGMFKLVLPNSKVSEIG